AAVVHVNELAARERNALAHFHHRLASWALRRRRFKAGLGFVLRYYHLRHLAWCAEWVRPLQPAWSRSMPSKPAAPALSHRSPFPRACGTAPLAVGTRLQLQGCPWTARGCNEAVGGVKLRERPKEPGSPSQQFSEHVNRTSRRAGVLMVLLGHRNRLARALPQLQKIVKDRACCLIPTCSERGSATASPRGSHGPLALSMPLWLPPGAGQCHRDQDQQGASLPERFSTQVGSLGCQYSHQRRRRTRLCTFHLAV